MKTKQTCWKKSIKNPIFQEYIVALQRIADIDFHERIEDIKNEKRGIRLPNMGSKPNHFLRYGISNTLENFQEFVNIPKIKHYPSLGSETYPENRKTVYQISEPLDTLIARCAFAQYAWDPDPIEEKEIPNLIKILKNNPRNMEYKQLIFLGDIIMRKNHLEKFKEVYNILRNKK